MAITDDKLPWFPCFPEKLLGAIAGMPPAQGYLYIVVILRIYEVGGPLKDRVDALARRTGLNRRVVSDAMTALVHAKKLVQTEDGWINPFAEKIITDQQRRKDGRAEAGRKGGRAKWGEDSGKKTRHQRIREAREKGTHTPEEWDALLQACQARCVKCWSSGVVKDHIIPVAKGGSDSIDNLQPLCATCNGAKGNEQKDYRPTDWKNKMFSIIEALPSQAFASGNREQTPAYVQEHKIPAPRGAALGGDLFEPDNKKKKVDPTPEERDLFRRGKEVLGEKAGGMIVNLLNAKGRNVSSARAAIETASTTQNPREFIGAAIRGPRSQASGGNAFARRILERKQEDEDGDESDHARSLSDHR